MKDRQAEGRESGLRESGKTTWPSLARRRDPSTAAQRPGNWEVTWERTAPGPIISWPSVWA